MPPCWLRIFFCNMENNIQLEWWSLESNAVIREHFRTPSDVISVIIARLIVVSCITFRNWVKHHVNQKVLLADRSEQALFIAPS